jgi:DnaD/phage-associated family protein
MSALLLPNDILSLSAQAAQRLIASGSGDGALLYLALLDRGGDPEQARRALKWDSQRLRDTYALLSTLELVRPDDQPQAPPLPAQADVPPEYSRSDVLHAMEGETAFSGLYRAVESCLGKPMSETDLKSLYTIYDYLALPAEVILMLAHWCVSETERKYGEGKRPRMTAVKKEAFRWKRLGLDTVESAEDFLRKQQELVGREKTVLPLLGIRDRPPVDREREYIASWVDMGFADDAIRLAYERTLFQKQQMNWAYMNSILKRWHQAGYHTAAQAEAGDKPPKRAVGPAQAPRPAQEDRQQSAQKLKQDVDWMDEFLKQQKG